MVICLNMCPDCCRGLLIHKAIANKTAFSVSTYLEYLLHGPQLRCKISRKEKHEEEEEDMCLMPLHKTHLLDGTRAPSPSCHVSFLLALLCAQ